MIQVCNLLECFGYFDNKHTTSKKIRTISVSYPREMCPQDSNDLLSPLPKKKVLYPRSHQDFNRWQKNVSNNNNRTSITNCSCSCKSPIFFQSVWCDKRIITNGIIITHGVVQGSSHSWFHQMTTTSFEKCIKILQTYFRGKLD